MSKRTERTLLLLVIAVGVGLRFWGIRFGLPHDFARPDEEKIVRAAFGAFLGDLNPHMFLYPTLFIYLTSAAYRLAFFVERVSGATATQASFVASLVADPSPLYLIARETAAVTGVVTIPILYAAAAELVSRRVALIAAALLAVAFLHVRDSHFGVTDVPFTFLTVCALWAAARCAARGVTFSRVAIAGLLSGLAASTKYNAALAVAPAIVAIAGHVRKFQRGWVTVAAASALLFACLASGFLVGSPYVVLDRATFTHDFTAQRQIILEARHALILDEARRAIGQRGWTYNFTFVLRYGLGLPLLAAALLGAIWLLFEQPLKAALVLSFPLIYYAAMGLSELVYARYMVPLVPFLCLTAAILVDRAAEVVGKMLDSRRAVAVCTMLLLAIVAVPTAAQSIRFDRLAARTDTRVRGSQWMEARFPAGATMYQTGLFYGHLQPRPRARYTQYSFDEQPGRFELLGQPVGLPDVIVVLDSPLVVFNHVPEQLDAILRTSYVWTTTFNTAPGAVRVTETVYDQQDAFYVPFGPLAGLTRPGPDVRIYERRRQ